MIKRNSTKKRKNRLYVITIFVLFIAVILILGINRAKHTYISYVESRDQRFIVHDPLSTKLFCIDAEQIDHIHLLGKYPAGVDRYKSSHVGSARLVSDECIQEVVDILNSFSFSFVRQGKPGEKAGTAIIDLIFDDEENLIVNYKDNAIGVNDFWYYGDSEAIDKLCVLGDKYALYIPDADDPVY